MNKIKLSEKIKSKEKILITVFGENIALDFYIDHNHVGHEEIKFDKNLTKNIYQKVKNKKFKNPQYYLILTNDEENVIYDILKIPSGLQKKYIKKAIENLINQKYINFNKNEYIYEYIELSNQAENKVILIKIVNKKFLQHFIDLERVVAVTSDIEIINSLEETDNNLYINFNDKYVTIVGFNDIGLNFFNKIQRNFTEQNDEEINILTDYDKNNEEELIKNELSEEIGQEVQYYETKELSNSELTEVNNYIKLLFFDENYKPQKITLLQGNSKLIEKFKEETGIDLIFIDKEILYKKCLEMKTTANAIKRYINRHIYKNVLLFLLALIITVESGAYYLNKQTQYRIDELSKEEKKIQREIANLNQIIEATKNRIENKDKLDYEMLLQKVKEYKSKRLSSILYLLPTVTTKTVSFNEISVSEEGKITIKGVSKNYSDIGFFVHFLEKVKDRVVIKSITGQQGNLSFEIEIENGV